MTTSFPSTPKTLTQFTSFSQDSLIVTGQSMANARQKADENDGCSVCENGLLVLDSGRRAPGEGEAPQRSQTLSAQLFHQDCETCSADVNTGKNFDLCTFCQHLRLRHLLRCMNPDEPPMYETFVKFCRVEDIPERVPFCLFCRLVVRTALPYRWFFGVASPADLRGAIVTISVGRGYLWTRVEYPDSSWGHGRNINFDDELTQTKQPQKTMEESSSESASSWAGGIRTPEAKAMVGSHVNWTWSTAGKKKLKQQCRKVLVGSHVNWSLGWRWLDDCLENHGAFCTRERAGSLPVGFRLIDVDRRCVVETQANSRHEFVALSYVWGQQTDPTRLFATKSNRERLKIDGSLSVLDLPKTVEDAIEACRQLGEVYLWVDRFCIVQDDLEDKARQISAMATIYSLAKFALIITDGDSDSGIAGISRERTQGQMCEQIAGFDFISDPTQWREIIGGASVWSTRGWTYQEAILPQRKLYLSESQAFFECATEVVHERGEIEQGMYSPHGLNTFPWNPRYVTFYSHLKKYRKRSLTNRADVYNAIDGIASALYGCSQALLSGLPRQEFDEALLWCLDAHNDENPQGPAFNGSSPSWSWSSTDRELILLDDTNRMPIDYCDTLTAWNRISHDGKYVESVRTMPAGKPLSHFQENQDSCSCCRDWWFNAKRDAERLLFSVLAWSQGCINRPCPFAQPHETTWAAMRAEIRARWSCRHRYWLEALQDVTISSPSPSMPSASTVFASVQSASFRLQGSVQRVEPSQRPFNDLRIAHPDGQLAGLLVVGDPGLGLGPEIIAKSKFEFIALSIGTSSSIVLPDGQIKLIFKWDMGSDEEIEEDEKPDAELCRDYRTRHEPEPAPEVSTGSKLSALHCEDEPGVAASQPLDQDTQAQPESEPDSSNTPECQWDPDKYRRCHPTSLSVEELQKLTFRDGAGKLLCPLPVVNVMMVERTGENSVRRISVGWIYLTSWIRAEPKFVTVFLE